MKTIDKIGAFIILLIAILVLYGIMPRHITETIEIKMDDNTRDFLIEHDYCVFIENSYDLNISNIMFFGDCKYMDYNLWRPTNKEDEDNEEYKNESIILLDEFNSRGIM